MPILVSPVRYQGSKRSLMSQIKSLTPTDCPRMIDAFGGSATVVCNMNQPHRIYCESHQHVYNIIKVLCDAEPSQTVARIRRIVRQWCLTNSNPDQYFAFRAHANQRRDPLMYYILHRHAHSNLIRFNQSGEFNTPFGNRGLIGRWEELEREIYQFYYAMQGVRLVNMRYGDLLNKVKSSLNENTFIYFDPPYLASGANAYDGWSVELELKLLRNLEHLTRMGVRWMLSNVVRHRHFENKLLEQWLRKNKIRVVYPQKSYAFANAQQDSHSTVEIIAMNY